MIYTYWHESFLTCLGFVLAKQVKDEQNGIDGELNGSQEGDE